MQKPLARPDTAIAESPSATMAACRSGSADAFAELYHAHVGLVYGICRRVLGPGAAAEDATQAVFIVLWRRAALLPDATNVAAWCVRAAELTALNLRRDLRRRARYERAAAPGQADASACDSLEIDIDRAVARLSEAQRAAITIVYYEQRSRTDAARALGISLDALRRRLSDALSLLRRRLRAPTMATVVAMLATSTVVAIGALPSVLGDPPALRGPYASGLRLAIGCATAGSDGVSIARVAGIAALAAMIAISVLAAVAGTPGAHPVDTVDPIRATELGDDDIPSGPPRMLGTAQIPQPSGGRFVLWSWRRWDNYPLATYDFERGSRGDHPAVGNDIQLLFGSVARGGTWNSESSVSASAFPGSTAPLQKGVTGCLGSASANDDVDTLRVGCYGEGTGWIKDIGTADARPDADIFPEPLSGTSAPAIVGHVYVISYTRDDGIRRWLQVRVLAHRDDDAVLLEWCPLDVPDAPAAKT
jgi:RNA polymerase sigma factor (sigma-70 family)